MENYCQYQHHLLAESKIDQVRPQMHSTSVLNKSNLTFGHECELKISLNPVQHIHYRDFFYNPNYQNEVTLSLLPPNIARIISYLDLHVP